MHTGDNTEQIWAHWFSQSQKRLQLGEGGEGIREMPWCGVKPPTFLGIKHANMVMARVNIG